MEGRGLGKPGDTKEIGSILIGSHKEEMTEQEFEERILAWARKQPDIEALIQFGSRVSDTKCVNGVSDWDFHLYTRSPARYRGTTWLEGIAPVWCANVERSSRGAIKISVFFEGGYEADFIPLAAWQMKLVFSAMRHPNKMGFMPTRLRNGILEMREIYLNSGTRVLVGGEAWMGRLLAIQIPWVTHTISVDEFNHHVGSFWKKSVWVTKKVSRPEPRSAMLWLNRLIVEHVYALLEEEAWAAGHKARPEALKAEQWLDARRLEQTDITLNLDQKVLARALLAQIDLFEEVSRSVATARGFPLRDHSAVAAWLRAELGRVLADR